MKRKKLLPLPFIVALSCLPLVSGCSYLIPNPLEQGAILDPKDYEKLTPGKTTKDEAIAFIGSPTTHATFDDNTWIYITMTTGLIPASYPGIKSQRVVILNFDNGGILQDIKVLHKGDAKPVSMVSRVTPTPGTKISVMQELLGSVGRYNPLGGMGGAFGGLGGMGRGGMGSGMMGGGAGGGGTGNTL
ncbi:outer membrane protein assembly factor BamE [Acetobacteraceae bacterium]|nr:outer membrane protein assembly factor BamE [Acetobacteraceae bacterium]